MTTEQIKRTPYFENPLIPVGTEPSKEQNEALLFALDSFSKRKAFDDISSLEQFVHINNNSPWYGSSYLTMGREYFLVGKFSKALNAYELAWKSLKEAKEADAKQIADRAFGELVSMHARLGRFEELETLLPQIENRPLTGSVTELISSARSGYWLMKNQPEVAFRCGTCALGRILSIVNPQHSFSNLFQDAKSSKMGMSLLYLFNLSTDVGLKYQLARRMPGAPILFPSIAHYKLNHYCAITQENNGMYKIEDSTFGSDFSVWVSRQTIEEEMSGSFLVPAGSLPNGWEVLSEKEATNIWGKGATGTSDERATGQCDEKAKSECGSKGMATWNAHLMLVSLNIQDTPLSYTPPRGMPINIELTYNQKEANQPPAFNYFNVGHKWTLNWITYISDSPGTPNSDVRRYIGGGGLVNSSSSSSSSTTTGSTIAFHPDILTSAIIVGTTPVAGTPMESYEITMPDGTKQVFERTLGIGNSRKIFLSRVIDSSGLNTVTLDYYPDDPLITGLRLRSIIDALGNRTMFEYDTTDPFLIKRITDPFNRSCSFDYNSSNLLTRITDVIGITSQFTYGQGAPGQNADFINTMTTPYGDTLFAYSESNIGDPFTRSYTLDITTPDGGHETIQYLHDRPLVDPVTGQNITHFVELKENPSEVPAKVATTWSDWEWGNHDLNYRNTFYWDKKTMQEHPYNPQINPIREYRYAKVFHFQHDNEYARTSRVLESFKMPLENRIWLRYASRDPDYPYTLNPVVLDGAVSKKPALVSRVVDTDNGAITQHRKYQYNDYGLTTQEIDPMGRETVYFYRPNNLDVEMVRRRMVAAPPLRQPNAVIQRGDPDYHTISVFEYNDPAFPTKPSRILDASMQPTTFSYNQFGQIQTVINAKNETTRLHYDTAGFLTEIELPLSGTSKRIRFVYDVINGRKINRIASVTDTEGFNTTYQYDALDRLTRVNYPDLTFETNIYSRLDLVQVTNREGQTTRYQYNNLGQVVMMQDALTQPSKYVNIDWCRCGDVRRISYGTNGINATDFYHDIQGRLIERNYNGSNPEIYEYYGRSGLLKNKVQGQRTNNQRVTNYTYYPDNNIKAVSYYNSTVETSNDPMIPVRQSTMKPVNYEYDAFFNRLSKVLDEFSTTQYNYFPVLPTPTTGALSLQRVVTAITFPDLRANSIVDFQYDVLGRETYRNLNGSRASGSQAAKSFSTSKRSNYDALGRIIFKNDATGDHTYTYSGLSSRLLNVNNGLNLHTQFEWETIFPRLKSISDLNGSGLLHKHEYKYNKNGDIIQWVLTNPKSSALNKTTSLNFTYDAIGQLTAENFNNGRAIMSTDIRNVYDEFDNRMETSTTSNNPLSPSRNTITFGYNGLNQLYSISPAPGNWTGNNMFNDCGENIQDYGPKEYQWDPAGRIRRIMHTNEATPQSGKTHFTEISYDSFNRIIRITEKKMDPSNQNKSIVTTDKVFISCFNEICVELTNSYYPMFYDGTRYYTGEGFVEPSRAVRNPQIYFYSKDHLGSIRQIYDATGAVTGVNYEYDRWGVRTKQIPAIGSAEFENIPFGFCGYFYHERSGLYFTKYRAYNPKIGRWLSRDPIGEEGGLNLYAYVGNNPVNRIDRYGTDDGGITDGGVPSNGVSVCNRHFDNPTPILRHCFVYNRTPGDSTSAIDRKNTQSFDLQGAHTDPNPNYDAQCSAPYSVDWSCIEAEYKKCGQWTPINNCCTCAHNAIKKCGGAPAKKDFNKNFGLGIPNTCK